MLRIRQATIADLASLLALEKKCFSYDWLSRRSFKHFLQSPLATVLIAEDEQAVQGYGLVLFHRGTSLARIYSLAVIVEARGRGLGARLIAEMEQEATERGALYVRLEVAQDNETAIQLYRRQGYRPVAFIENYYDNGQTACRMEKRLQRHSERPANVTHFRQTTDFTCGPAALLMAMHFLKPDFPVSQREELRIWREATSIFMTSGHGGCSPHGLALAASNRQFVAELWVSSNEVPLLSSVRSEDKKQIITSIHEDFCEQLRERQVPVRTQPISLTDLKTRIAEGYAVLLLISTYRLDRVKAPHWIWLVNIDDQYAYINDPYIDDKAMQNDCDNTYVPVPHEAFKRMLGYGSRRYRAAVLVANHTARGRKKKVQRGGDNPAC